MTAAPRKTTVHRVPEGDAMIPFAYKVFDWKSGPPTLTIECDPREYRRTNLPKISGWEAFFIGFHGYDQPMHVSYKWS